MLEKHFVRNCMVIMNECRQAKEKGDGGLNQEEFD
jgi:hypothetical protein